MYGRSRETRKDVTFETVLEMSQEDRENVG
jgi:hypothetical protein